MSSPDPACEAKCDAAWNEAIETAAGIAETLVMARNVTPQGHVTNIRRGATGQEIADEIRRQLLRKVEP